MSGALISDALDALAAKRGKDATIVRVLTSLETELTDRGDAMQAGFIRFLRETHGRSPKLARGLVRSVADAISLDESLGTIAAWAFGELGLRRLRAIRGGKAGAR